MSPQLPLQQCWLNVDFKIAHIYILTDAFIQSFIIILISFIYK